MNIDTIWRARLCIKSYSGWLEHDIQSDVAWKLFAPEARGFTKHS